MADISGGASSNDNCTGSDGVVLIAGNENKTKCWKKIKINYFYFYFYFLASADYSMLPSRPTNTSFGCQSLFCPSGAYKSVNG